MSTAEFVSALYRHVLGREADPAGLQQWIRIVEESGDPTIAFAGLLASSEYLSQSAKLSQAQYETSAAPIVRWLRAFRPLFIVDVGAQLLGVHAYQQLIDVAGLSCKVVAFEPLLQRLDERTSAEAGMDLAMLPYAIGDGTPGTLYVNNLDGTSSLLPLNEGFTQQFLSLTKLRTERIETLETRRLDDILSADANVDFLKLDIQGGELAALKGAEAILERTCVIHCEVEFAPIYLNQPLFCDVHAFLAARGFEFIDLVKPTRYAYDVPSRRSHGDRLIWDEAVFFRTATTAREDPWVLAAQALIALVVYNKPTLAERLLVRHDELTGAGLPQKMRSAGA